MKGVAVAIFVCVFAFPASSWGGKYVTMCRDKEGNPVFSDVGCPTDTTKEARFQASGAQGYSREWRPGSSEMLRSYQQRIDRNLATRQTPAQGQPATATEPTLTFDQARQKALTATGYRNYGNLTRSQRDRVDAEMTKYNHLPPDLQAREDKRRAQLKALGESETKERERIKKIENTYRSEKKWNDLGVIGRQHHFNKAVDDCKQNIKAHCR